MLVSSVSSNKLFSPDIERKPANKITKSNIWIKRPKHTGLQRNPPIKAAAAVNTCYKDGRQ